MFEEIFQTVKKEGIEDNVPILLITTKNGLLYQNAIASILPSTYEGFGIPAIESMKIGTPVIVSHIPPFKEVVAESGLFINPNSESDLIEK